MFPLQTIVIPSILAQSASQRSSKIDDKIDKIIKNNQDSIDALLHATSTQQEQDDLFIQRQRIYAILFFERFPFKVIAIPIGSLIGYCSGGPYLGSRIRHTSLLLGIDGETMHAFNNDKTLRIIDRSVFPYSKVYGFLYPKNPLFFIIYRKVRRKLVKKYDTCFKYISNIFTSEARTLVHPFKRCILKEGKETVTPSPFDQMMLFRNILTSTSKECPQKLPVVCSTFLFYLYLVILFEMMIFRSRDHVLQSTQFDPDIIAQFNQKYNWTVGRCWPFHIREIATSYPDDFGFQLVDEYLL
jgi:hypothetical protein